ncbi:PLP-dependent aminotransferase family protein [Agromyces lapidis]|uniref:PLP-dependent aminotransferase family protein n=1 Tax=Agromyces lapidis TaxID=279574 RepID=A0ABV5SLF1_9MICO|nr:PLP-dependent aminotransferase family protein [Agromyces lapidis]
MTDATLSARALENLLGDWRGAARGAVYLALAERVRLLILDGRVSVETRLPAERELADRLGLSRTTVTAAYRHLREQGLLRSLRGSGSVARLPGAPAAMPAPPASLQLDLSKAAPAALPWLAEVAREAADELPAHLGDSGFDPIGTPALRQAIADRYALRGLPTSPDQIMVTIGAQHAIALLSRVLVGRGDRAVIEAPTYPHAYEALRVAGARLVTVPVSPHDAIAALTSSDDEVEALERAFARANPSAAYLMPDFQNPTGRSLDESGRERVLDAAARQGTVIIADETTAELDIDRAFEPLPLAAYGPPGTAVLIGSVGKTVWGGVRIGWIRAEPTLIRKLVAVRAPGDLGTPILEQLLVTRLMPRMDEILALRRAELRAGRDRLEELIAEAFPEWHVPHVDGGIATWIGIGAPVSSQLALAARSQGLLIAAGPRFGIDGAFERFLRLPICQPVAETEAAVQALRVAWESMAGMPAVDVGLLPAVV